MYKASRKKITVTVLVYIRGLILNFEIFFDNKYTPSSSGLFYIMQKEYIPNIPEH